MSAADQIMTQRVPSRGFLRRLGRPRSWQLFALPSPVVGYVFAIISADLGLTVQGILHTPDGQPRMDSHDDQTPDPAALNQDAPEPRPAAGDTGGGTGDSTA